MAALLENRGMLAEMMSPPCSLHPTTPHLALCWLPGPWRHLQPPKVPACKTLDPPLEGGRQLDSTRWAAGRVQSPGNECGHGAGPVGLPTLGCLDQVPGGV